MGSSTPYTPIQKRACIHSNTNYNANHYHLRYLLQSLFETAIKISITGNFMELTRTTKLATAMLLVLNLTACVDDGTDGVNGINGQDGVASVRL